MTIKLVGDILKDGAFKSISYQQTNAIREYALCMVLNEKVPDEVRKHLTEFEELTGAVVSGRVGLYMEIELGGKWKMVFITDEENFEFHVNNLVTFVKHSGSISYSGDDESFWNKGSSTLAIIDLCNSALRVLFTEAKFTMIDHSVKRK